MQLSKSSKTVILNFLPDAGGISESQHVLFIRIFENLKRVQVDKKLTF